MDRLKSILVGIDFTPCSACALQQAVRIANWNQAQLHAVHIIETLVLADMEAAMGKVQPDVRGQVVRAAEHHWKQFAAQIPGAEGVSLKIEIDHPVTALLRHVQNNGHDLMILGVHGLTPASRGAGPVAAALTRKAMTRVLLVEEGHGGPFKKIVACIDFSATSRMALEQAVRVAMQDQAELHVLHVFDAPWNHLHYRTETAEASPTFQKQYTDSLEQQLRLFGQPLESDLRTLKVQYHVFNYGGHGGGIVKFALEQDADLVVLGTRGRTNLRDLIMGSTAERVVRDTPCSMLTVKPD